MVMHNKFPVFQQEHLKISRLIGSRNLYLIEQVQQLFVSRDIAHGMSVMRISRDALTVYDNLGRHTSQLKQIDLLAEESEHGVGRIRQTDEWKAFLFPV